MGRAGARPKRRYDLGGLPPAFEPDREIGERAGRERGLPRLASLAAARLLGHRREEPEIDVHRLEVAIIGAAGDMGEKRAQRRGRRGRGERATELPGGEEAPGQQADAGTLDIAFDAGDLAREAKPRLRLEAQMPVEQTRAVEEGVAVEPPEPSELRLLEPGNHTEDPDLLGIFE